MELKNIKKFLVYLLPSLLILNFIMFSIMIPLENKYGILEDIFSVFCMIYLLLLYSGTNSYLVFFRDNLLYNYFMFSCMFINFCSKIILLLLFLKFGWVPMNFIGLFQSLLGDFIFDIAECMDQGVGKEIVPKQLDPFEKVYVGSQAIGISTTIGGTTGIMLNTLPLTKKLPTLVKAVPITLSAFVAGFSTFSVEYKKISNVYPHQVYFKAEPYTYSYINDIMPMSSLRHIDLLDYHSFEQYLIYNKPYSLFLDILTKDKLPVADIFVDYSQIVPNDLIYRPFCSTISEDFVNHLYHLYLNYDLQGIINFLYTYHGLSYADLTRLLMCMHKTDVMTYDTFKLFLGL